MKSSENWFTKNSFTQTNTPLIYTSFRVFFSLKLPYCQQKNGKIYNLFRTKLKKRKLGLEFNEAMGPLWMPITIWNSNMNGHETFSIQSNQLLLGRVCTLRAWALFIAKGSFDPAIPNLCVYHHLFLILRFLSLFLDDIHFIQQPVWNSIRHRVCLEKTRHSSGPLAFILDSSHK